jgi:hypothetical protein
MNRSISKTLETPTRLYSNLKFEKDKSSLIKEGVTVILEETGKIYMDEMGIEKKIFRIRKKNRNYYMVEELEKN